jgi:hypothetical protein
MLQATAKVIEFPIVEKVAVSLPDRPMDVSVIHIHHGIVKRGTLNTKLPYGASLETFFTAAPKPLMADSILSAVVEVSARCAPWVRVVMGPRIWSWVREGSDTVDCRTKVRIIDGRLAYEHGGVAWGRPFVPEGADELVMLKSWTNIPYALEILHHELWHVLEYYISPEDLDFITATVGHGLPMPGIYLDSQVERRARCYESYARARDEGWRPVRVMGTPVSRTDRIFEYVYSGQLAADVTAKRRIHARLLPGQAPVRAVVREIGFQGIAAGTAYCWFAGRLWGFW